ncbi:MAG: hypothetical protein RLZZ377_212, partial [Chloroflexota bacterium]
SAREYGSNQSELVQGHKVLVRHYP